MSSAPRPRRSWGGCQSSLDSPVVAALRYRPIRSGQIVSEPTDLSFAGPIGGRRGFRRSGGRALGDLSQELVVALGRADLVHEQFESGSGAALVGQGIEHSAQLPDLLELRTVEEQLLMAGGTGVDVDRRVQPALGQSSVEPQLHVAGALELLEDHFVHL